jgi:hypothetical protein
MNISEQDRRALKILAVAVGAAALYLGYEFWPASSVATPITATSDSVEVAEQRLARLRDIAASAPAKQDVLKKVAAELAVRESGLIRTETAQQAQAVVITKVRELLMQEAPPIDLRGTELAAIEPLGDAYGLAPVSVQFECRVEQLINVLAAIATQAELITTRDVQITTANPKDKTVRVRLTLAGVVPKSLVPDKTTKKGPGL